MEPPFCALGCAAAEGTCRPGEGTKQRKAGTVSNPYSDRSDRMAVRSGVSRSTAPTAKPVEAPVRAGENAAMIGRLEKTVLDCPDPRALAAFYAEVLGMRVNE